MFTGDTHKLSWTITKASVRGESHLINGSPCQDASEVCTDASGRWGIAVVCDGAGSAKRSDEGARKVSIAFRSALLELALKLDTHEPGNWITDFIAQKILDIRVDLRILAKNDDIAPFNSTLVACLTSPSGGFSVHIGDGAIFGENTNGDLEIISSPENGEYANETFFVTEPHWIRHIRITPMKPMKWLSLCTDGGTSLTMNNEKTVKTGFVYPVLKKIIETDDPDEKIRVLEEVLSDPKANAVTQDDKTVVIMIASSLGEGDIVEPIEVQSVPTNITPIKYSEINAANHKDTLSDNKKGYKIRYYKSTQKISSYVDKNTPNLFRFLLNAKIHILILTTIISLGILAIALLASVVLSGSDEQSGSSAKAPSTTQINEKIESSVAPRADERVATEEGGQQKDHGSYLHEDTLDEGQRDQSSPGPETDTPASKKTN